MHFPYSWISRMSCHVRAIYTILFGDVMRLVTNRLKSNSQIYSFMYTMEKHGNIL